MRRKIINLIFIILFLVASVIPCIHIDFHSEKSYTENRYLGKYGQLFKAGRINLNYGKEFESWFNDRFFGRPLLLSINNKINVSSKLSVVGNNSVLLGDDGFLFYRGDYSEANFANATLFTECQMNGILNYLNDIQSWCKENGKLFIFFIAPDKNKVYGELYPSVINKVRKDTESRTYQFVKHANENSSVPIVYPLNVLLEAKSKGKLLYYKNDTHWNEYGAYYGYKELEKEIRKYITISDFEVTEWQEKLHPKGDLNNLYPEGTSEDVSTLYLFPIFNSIYKIDNERNLKDERDGFFTTCPNRQTKAVVFRDSFCIPLKQYISSNFSEVQYLWKYNILPEDLENIEKNVDVIILEIVERYLPTLSNLKFTEFK